MLAAHAADHDTVGQWMAHHLAELVVAAQDHAATTVEQRQEIIGTILTVWTHRRSFPGRAPLEEFLSVLEGLDRLGDDRPWRFLRPFGAGAEPPDPWTSGLSLAETAVEVERLARETVLRLLWLAAKDAKDTNQEWLKVADNVASNIESDVTASLRRLSRRATLRRLRAAADSSADGVLAPTTEDTCGDPLNKDEAGDGDPLSDTKHAKRLREMADRLNALADALEASGTDLRQQ